MVEYPPILYYTVSQLALVLSRFSNQLENSIHHINEQSTHHSHTQSPSYLLIDVRESDEFNQDHIDGALVFPLSVWKTSDVSYIYDWLKSQITLSTQPLIQQKVHVILYCLRGIRSEKAISHLHTSLVESSDPSSTKTISILSI